MNLTDPPFAAFSPVSIETTLEYLQPLQGATSAATRLVNIYHRTSGDVVAFGLSVWVVSPQQFACKSGIISEGSMPADHKMAPKHRGALVDQDSVFANYQVRAACHNWAASLTCSCSVLVWGPATSR